MDGRAWEGRFVYGGVDDVIAPRIFEKRTFGELYHVFAHLKKHHNAEMPFDPTPPEM